MFQTNEQVVPKEQLSEEERGNLPKREFRVMLVKMIQKTVGAGSRTKQLDLGRVRNSRAQFISR